MDYNAEVERIERELNQLKDDHKAEEIELKQRIAQMKYEFEFDFRAREENLQRALIHAHQALADNTPLQTLHFTPIVPKAVKKIAPGMIVTCADFVYVERETHVKHFVSDNILVPGTKFHRTTLIRGRVPYLKGSDKMEGDTFVILKGGNYQYSASMGSLDSATATKFHIRQITINHAQGTASYNPNSELFEYDSNCVTSPNEDIICIGHVTNALVETFQA